jgi:O-antigen ligase
VKWIVFVLALVAVVPAGIYLRRRPHLVPRIYTLIPFLIFYGLDSLDINVVSFEDYRGDSRGIEVTVVDLLIGALAIGLPPARGRSPYPLQRWAYLLAVLVSVWVAPVALYASFSVWKLVRMYAVFLVTVRACENPEVPPGILRGLAFGLFYELSLCVQQRYLMHMHQTPGNLGHQNTVGMAVNLIVPAMFAMALEKQGGRLAWAAVAAGIVTVLLTLSRGAMSMLAVGLGVTYAFSLWRNASGRKLLMAVAGLFGVLLVLIQAWDSIVDRFLNAPSESAEGRELFELAASQMLHDHPLGVGINLFSHVLDHGGYGRGVDLPEYDRSGIVHNVYWLTAAEVGWAGLAAFLLLLASPVFTAFRAGLTGGRDVRRDVLFGLGVGLVALYAQGTLEWAFRQTTLSYLFWMLAGIIVGLSRALRPPER